MNICSILNVKKIILYMYYISKIINSKSRCKKVCEFCTYRILILLHRIIRSVIQMLIITFFLFLKLLNLIFFIYIQIQIKHNGHYKKKKAIFFEYLESTFSLKFRRCSHRLPNPLIIIYFRFPIRLTLKDTDIDSTIVYMIFIRNKLITHLFK